MFIIFGINICNRIVTPIIKIETSFRNNLWLYEWNSTFLPVGLLIEEFLIWFQSFSLICWSSSRCLSPNNYGVIIHNIYAKNNCHLWYEIYLMYLCGINLVKLLIKLLKKWNPDLCWWHEKICVVYFSNIMLPYCFNSYNMLWFYCQS